MSKQLLSFLGAFICVFSLNAQTGGHYALNFNGSGDDVTIKDDKALNPTDEITIEAWIKPESFARNIYENTIFGKHGWSSGNAGYVLRCGASGQLSFNVASTGGSWMEAQSGTGVLQTNVWNHVAGVFDGDTVSIYVNGIRVGTRVYKGAINPSTGLDAKIGELAYGSGRNFDGDIDEVRVWNKAVPTSTRRDWMCRKITSSHPSYKSLVAYYKIDEGTGKAVADISGNKLNGAINGATWSNSGAPIGDFSVNSYVPVSKLSLTGDSADVFSINNISGKYQSVHLYRMKGKTQITKASSGTVDFDTLQSWGVYYGSPSSVSHNVQYNYAGFKGKKTIDICRVDLFQRTSLPTWQWNAVSSRLYVANDSITISNSKAGEYILGNTSLIKKITTNTGDSSFCSAESLTLNGPGNSSYSYKWFKDGKALANDTLSSLTVSKAGKYSCEYSRGTGCVFKSNVMTVTSVKSPSVSLSSLSNVCIDQDTVIISGGLPGGGIYTGSSIGKGDSTFFPSTLTAGVYNIAYTYTNKNGCTSADTQRIEIWRLPNVSVKKSYSICDNLDTVRLSGGRPSGGTYTGAGISSNVFYLDSISRKTGKYNYKYVYADANGCSSDASSTIQVVASTPITFNPIDTSCENEGAFRIKTNPNQGTYSGKGMNGRDFSPKVAGVGSHLISFEFKNIDGCITTASQYAVVKGVTKASFNASNQLCVNDDTLKLQSGKPAGGIYIGPGVVNGVFDPAVSGVGSTQLAYLFTNADGCTDTATSTIDVNDITKLDVTEIDPLCFNEAELTLQNVSPSGGTYSGKGVASGGFIAKNAGAGLHNISYEYVNKDGCKSAADFNIEVLEQRAIKFDVDNNLCDNADSIDLSATRPKGGVHLGSGVRNEFLVPSLMSTGKNWLVYRQVDINDCVNRDSIEIELLEAPEASLSGQASLCDNDAAITLSGGTPSNGVFIIDGNEVSTFDPSTEGAGEYEVTYRVEASNGCTDETTKNFWVNESPEKPSISENNNTLTSSAADGNQWYDANGAIDGETSKKFTPSTSGNYYVVVTNDSLCSAQSDVFSFTNSSVNTLSANGIVLYPNPSTGFIALEFQSNNSIQSLSIFSLSGKEMLSLSKPNQLQQIDISHLSDGIYMVNIYTENGAKLIEKLVVSKH